MTVLCGYLAIDGPETARPVVESMLRALRCHQGQTQWIWESKELTAGLLEVADAIQDESEYSPALCDSGRYSLWMAGEVFSASGLFEIESIGGARSLAFRKRLLSILLEKGLDEIARFDGEFQVLLWDAVERNLTILNDRFGSLPMYWSKTASGFAFAGGVRGVLMAPSVSLEPDLEAIRESVSFGGFRLGDRTNIAAVKMLQGGSILTVKKGSVSIRRYWKWRDIPAVPNAPIGEVVDQLHYLWQQSIKRRLVGVNKPGQTLSGGLDSRAILAEAAPQARKWVAITYGISGCDDQKYAGQAARVVGADWHFQELYGTETSVPFRDWLDVRTAYIHQTDGLIDLTDLMHLETLPLQVEHMDCHLSGYIGDAVSGPTFNDVRDAAGILSKLPYYGTELGLCPTEAIERAEAMIHDLGGASPRFALFDHKLPQSTNRWGNAWRPWFRVRRPFTDYEFFDFCQGLAPEVRGEVNVHERWLKYKYPSLFARIPNQKTGLPILSPRWLLTVERGRRFAWKKTQLALSRLGGSWKPRIRNYSADEIYWPQSPFRQRIEEMILRAESICCNVLGRASVKKVVSNYFDRNAAATQIVGAMYVFEAYHASLREMVNVSRGQHI